MMQAIRKHCPRGATVAVKNPKNKFLPNTYDDIIFRTCQYSVTAIISSVLHVFRNMTYIQAVTVI